MFYLALDQALKVTGYAVYNGEQLYRYGSFSISGTKPIEQRLNLFIQELNNLYREYEFKELFFEDIQNQNNNETYKKLAYVQATIMIWCYNNNIKFHILSPSHWRKILKEKYKINFGRKREEQKEAAIAFVKQQYNKEVSSDEADAIALGCAAIIDKKQNQSAF